MEFRAVDRTELREILGHQCSPDRNREGYVIGPDSTGRLCHVASCIGLGRAVQYAKELNAKKENRS